MRRLLIPVLLLASAFLSAQEIDTDALLESLDEESLFGLTEEEAVEEVEEDVSPLEIMAAPENLFEWGGKVYSDLGSSLIWESLDDGSPESGWEPTFGFDLFFDARPSDSFRVFAKAKAFYPFEGSVENALTIHEVFTDFNMDNKVYFRVGKQTINWGVGYLYRPTDKLNLSPIDPADRSADREGPLAVKTQIPLGVNGVYLFAVANEIEKPEDITYAPKVEFLLGNWELGAGAIINPSLTGKGALFVTGPVWKFDFFAEALFQYGSDLTFMGSSSEIDEELLLSVTGGLLFYDGGRRFTAIGQYWYDAEAQSAEDWETVGHHFAGVTVEKGFVLQPEKDNSAIINLSVLWLGNFTDMSGMIIPEVELEFIEYASLALGATCRYGGEEDYYRFLGPDVSAAPLEVKLSLRLGYGNF